jgi:hypothetical protein
MVSRAHGSLHYTLAACKSTADASTQGPKKHKYLQHEIRERYRIIAKGRNLLICTESKGLPSKSILKVDMLSSRQRQNFLDVRHLAEQHISRQKLTTPPKHRDLVRVQKSSLPSRLHYKKSTRKSMRCGRGTQLRTTFESPLSRVLAPEDI